MKRSFKVSTKASLIILSIGFLFVSQEIAVADKLCLRINKKRLTPIIRTVESSARCPKRFKELLDSSVLTGPQGVQGPQGADGLPGADAASIYGDGSAGNLTVNGFTTFSDLNAQFENITINPGQTLQLNAGTILRCSGNFENNGTLEVVVGSLGGRRVENPPSKDSNATRFPHQGLSVVPAISSSYGAGAVAGGPGGAISSNLATIIASRLYHGRAPAGSGGSGQFLGGHGGGAAYILCNGSITNSGLIFANGGAASNGGGGGAGGFIVLASATAVHNTNDGTIRAVGGNGGGDSVSYGGGGGGGGGVVHLAAPTVTNAGTIEVSGGIAGNTSTSVTDSPRFGGGGGGAFGGNGGSGASISVGNNQSGAGAGADGLIIINEIDPSGIY